MTASGDLRQRIAFASREAVSDGLGNEEGDWITRFTVWAQRIMLRGGENVIAARLEGRSPAVIVVRSSSQTRDITTDWRATDQRSGEVYNIRAVTPREKRDYIDLLVEKGVAV